MTEQHQQENINLFLRNYSGTRAQLQALTVSSGVTVGTVAWEVSAGRYVRCKTVDADGSTWVYTQTQWLSRQNTADTTSEKWFSWNDLSAETTNGNANSGLLMQDPGELNSLRIKGGASPGGEVTIRVYVDAVLADSAVVALADTNWVDVPLTTAVWNADSRLTISLESGPGGVPASMIQIWMTALVVTEIPDD